jgi:hypothetical protein
LSSRKGATPEELIKVPENAQYFAALGAVEFGKEEDPSRHAIAATELEDYIEVGRAEEKPIREARSGHSDAELADFKLKYAEEIRSGDSFQSRGALVAALSAWTAVRRRPRRSSSIGAGRILCKAYQLSNGNPIQDTIEMFEKLRSRWSRRAQRWKCWASAPPAMPRTS